MPNKNNDKKKDFRDMINECFDQLHEHETNHAEMENEELQHELARAANAFKAKITPEDIAEISRNDKLATAVSLFMTLTQAAKTDAYNDGVIKDLGSELKFNVIAQKTLLIHLEKMGLIKIIKK